MRNQWINSKSPLLKVAAISSSTLLLPLFLEGEVESGEDICCSIWTCFVFNEERASFKISISPRQSCKFEEKCFRKCVIEWEIIWIFVVLNKYSFYLNQLWQQSHVFQFQSLQLIIRCIRRCWFIKSWVDWCVFCREKNAK